MGGKTFKDLVIDGAFMQKMISQPTMEDAKKLFEAEGVAMTDQEMETLRTIIEKTITKGELSEEDLKEVVGAGTTAKIVGALIGAGLVGSALAGGGGFAGYKMGEKVNSEVPGAMIGGVIGGAAGIGAGTIAGAKLANWIVGDGKKSRN